MAQTGKDFKCRYCNSDNLLKKGIRKSKVGEIQKYYCKDCRKNSSATSQDLKQYPIQTILKSISTYNLGYNLKQVQEKTEKSKKIKIPISTISAWINQFKEICTYNRLRSQALKQYNYTPQNIIHRQTLNHVQPYTFKCHKAKLDILTKENPQFNVLKDYINKISSNHARKPTDKSESVFGANSVGFPHHIFTYNKNNEIGSNGNEQRASQLKFTHLDIKIINKNNQSNELAKLALNLAASNKDRHNAIQDFMLTNDSTTIAVEMPVYLTNWDAGCYKNQKGFIFPLSNYPTPITGHIDLLQIRNNLLHILDYKPDADKIKPIEQLTIYALALSRKLNLPLYCFKCAWFDEKNYYEFFPLHAVFPKRK